MRKMIIGSSCFVLLAFLISFVILPSAPRAANRGFSFHAESTDLSVLENASSLNFPVSDSSDSTSSTVPVYIIKIYEGSLAVFEEKADTPFRICDVPVSVLPKEDRQLLTEGIRVSGQSELAQVLEDYCS